MPTCSNCGVELEGPETYCPGCGAEFTGSREAGDDYVGNWNPKLPILSVYVSLVLLWTGFYTLSTTSSSSMFLFWAVPGALIIPRVRKQVLESVSDSTQERLTSQLQQYILGGLYSLHTLFAFMFIIGGVANNPRYSIGSTIVMLVMMFVLAAGIVVSVRKLSV